MALELNLSIITENLPLLLKGAGITLEITALSVGLGLLIGMFVGVAKLSDNRLIRGLASVYVDCIRGTPLLVQIFLGLLCSSSNYRTPNRSVRGSRRRLLD